MALPFHPLPVGFENGMYGGGAPRPIKTSCRRSLVPSSSQADISNDIEAIAFKDGRIFLLDNATGRGYGSFSSGSELATSYQTFATGDEVDHYFISPGNDGSLYEHTNELGKRKLNMTVEEYVESTPRTTKDGGITLSSKKSTTFLVDLISGNVISSQLSAGRQDQLSLFYNSTPTWARSNPGAISPLLITRTDYSIDHFLSSGKPQWGMTISVIEASSCRVCNDDGIMKQRNKITVHRAHGRDPLENEMVSATKVSTEKDEDKKELMNFSGVDEKFEGKQIGRLFLSNNQITEGSNGDVLLEGIIEGRPTAVKRLIRARRHVASEEIKNLIASDNHCNIVRWFGVENDSDFVYIALEHCICSLNDIIVLHSDPRHIQIAECSPNLKQNTKDVKLWKSDGCPTTQLLKIMRDVVSGVAHLHELGIVHGDINPKTILLTAKNKSLSAKLSGIGNVTGGWEAPEQLSDRHQTMADDLFGLGCVLFFCITKGRHVFFNHCERDSDIVNKREADLFLVSDIPEALHLFSALLDRDPEKRPQAAEVLQHPLFWSSEMRLSFLKDASDRAELDRECNSELVRALESVGPATFHGRWDKKCDASLLADISRHRRYRYLSTCDLLRVIRNKFNHYMELPKPLQELLGSNPDGFDQYFSARFPRLLMEVYKVMYVHCRDEKSFRKYFKSAEN